MSPQSEYSKLLELAISSGASHADLIDTIHQKISDHYKTLYPKTESPNIFIDSITGEVKIFSKGKDMTPKNFATLAEKIAREVLINSISNTNIIKDTSTTRPSSQGKEDSLSSFILGFLFWGYNLLFVVYSILFLINITINGQLLDLAVKTTSIQIFLVCIYLITPYIALLLAFRQLRHQTRPHYGKLIFLFELPIYIFTFIGYNLFPSITPSIGLTMIVLFTTIPLFYMHSANVTVSNSYLNNVLYALRQFLFLTLSYLNLLFLFFIPVYVVVLFTDYFDFDSIFDIFGSLVMVFWVLVLLVFVVLPFIALYYSAKIVRNAHQDIAIKTNIKIANSRLLVFSVIWFLAYAAVSYQPKPDFYLNKLSEYTKAETYEEKEEVVKILKDDEMAVKDAINSLQNARSYYPWHKGENILKREYMRELNLSEKQAQRIESTFKLFAYPFVYQQDLTSINTSSISQTYNEIFGSTSKSFKPVANVNLFKRNIFINTDYDGLLATVTVEEEYTNVLTREQEIIYEFYLPEGSVVTDLKLGPDLEFTGIIAPRGAAETTFNSQVQQKRDPALLEQVGTNTYRLRVFPIPSKNDTRTLNGRNQRVAFTYVTTATKDGYALPFYTRKSNIDDIGPQSVVTLNGNTLNVESEEIQKGTFIALNNKNLLCNSQQLSRSQYPEQIVESVSFNKSMICDNEQTISSKRIALFVDSSITNKDTQLLEKIETYFTNNPSFLTNNTVDLYKYSLNSVSAPQNITQSNYKELLDFPFFGITNTIPQLYNSTNRSYDLYFDLTNSTNPFFTKKTAMKLPEDLRLIYNDYPAQMNQDWTIKQLQFANPVFLSVDHAFRFSQNENGTFNPVLNTVFKTPENVQPSLVPPTSNPVIDTETVETQVTSIVTSSQDPLSYLVAQSYIYSLLGLTTPNLTQVNRLHEIATFANIVTPYSSNIALVNEAQLSQLERESLRANPYTELPSNQARNNTNLNFDNLETLDLGAPDQFSNLSNTRSGIGSSLFGVNLLSGDVASPTINSSVSNASPISAIGAFGLLYSLIRFSFYLLIIGFVVFFIRKLHKKNNHS